MSDHDKKADASKAAIKNEAVELHDDDLDAAAGGYTSTPSRCKSRLVKGGHVVEQYRHHQCKLNCGKLSGDDIDFIKGTEGKG